MTPEIWNYILGGGLLAAIVGIATLGSKIKEAKAKAEQALAEAKKMHAEAKSTELDNDKTLVDTFSEYIVTPLKTEVIGLRKDVRKFTRAVEKINDCPHAADCPVRRELQNDQNCYEECAIRTNRPEK